MKNVLKTLRNIALIATGVGIMASSNVSAQNLDAEAIKSLKPGSSYGRINASYKLPAEINGYTFGEFYSDGDSYFSKTALTKPVLGNVSVMGQIWNGTGMTDHAGIGVSAIIPTQEKTFAKAYIIPKYVASTGKAVDNKSVAGYYAEANLPLDMKISSFGEINLDGTKGPEWMYGELNLEKKLTDNISVSYNPALQKKSAGNLQPVIENRFTLKYIFK